MRIGEIQQQIQDYFVKEPHRSGLVPKPDESLLDSGIMDSMTFIIFLAFLEERFGVSIDVTNLVLDSFETIEKTARTVACLLGVEAE